MASPLNAPYILEIVSRGRGQPQFRRIRQFPYRVGRAYDNDLILSDDTISAAHLQFEQDADGALRVRNLSHENGTRLGRRKLGFVPEPMALPCTLELGHTQLRVLAQDTAVAPARRPQAVPGSLTLVERLPFALILLVLLFGFDVAMMFMNRIEPLTLRNALFNQAPELLAPIFTAVLTGFISRLLLHRWRFGLQLTIACVAFIVSALAQELLHRISYFYSSDGIAQLFNLMLAGSVFTALFAWQLRAFSTLSKQRSIGVAVAITWPLMALFWLQGVVRTPDFDEQPALHLALLATDLRRDETLDLSSFLQQTHNELQEGIDRELEQSHAGISKKN